MELPGMGELFDACCDVTGYISCPDGHLKIPLKDSCQRVDCPECFMDWARKAGHRISDRLRGVRSAYYHSRREEFGKVRSFRHFVFSPPQDLLSEDCTLDQAYALWKGFWRTYKPLNGGCVIYHPYRISDEAARGLSAYMKARGEDKTDEFYERGGLWQLARADVLGLGSFRAYFAWGPHFHVIGFGYAPNSDVFERETGWVYKNVGDRGAKVRIDKKSGTIIDEVELTARYQLSHAGVERGKSGKFRDAYRWFGICDGKHCRLVKNCKGGVIIRLTVDSVLVCPVCGRKLTASADCITGEVHWPEGWHYLLDKYGAGAVFVRKVFRMFEVIEDV